MERDTVIITLVLFTLLAGLATGFYQWYSVDRAKKQGSQSAIGDRDSRNSRPT
jgi:hypothetical protein